MNFVYKVNNLSNTVIISKFKELYGHEKYGNSNRPVKNHVNRNIELYNDWA